MNVTRRAGGSTVDRRHLLATTALIAASSVATPATARAATSPWRPPARFVQPTTRLVRQHGGVPLSAGWSGTRVALLHGALGLGARPALYDSTTASRVEDAQRRAGLRVTGVVDARTWIALRIPHPWTLDAWRPGIAVRSDASRAQRVEAMIHHALAQVGSPYVWGGAGPRALGHDCSGLVLAALAAAGLDPYPITVRRHQSPGYVTTQALFTAPMEHLPLAARRRGDLVFWFGPSGRTVHVAVYLGNGQMVEASGAAGRTRVTAYRGDYPGHRVASTVVRPFTALTR